MFPFIDYSDPSVAAGTTGLTAAQERLDASREAQVAAYRACAAMADEGCPWDIPAGQEEHHASIGGPVIDLVRRQVLLTLRTKNAFRHPTLLSNPGGRLAAGESVRDGLARVLQRAGIRFDECVAHELRSYEARNLPSSYKLPEPVLRIVTVTFVVNDSPAAAAHLRHGLVRVPFRDVFDMPTTLLTTEDLRVALSDWDVSLRLAS